MRPATDSGAAASTGIAYDFVLKVVTSSDPPLPQHDFDADFQDGTETEEFRNVREQSFASPHLMVTRRDTWTYEFLPKPLPALACIEPAAAWFSRYGWPQQCAPEEVQDYFAARFSKVAGPRDRITESGPQLPDWRIPLYAVSVHEQRQSDAFVSMRYFEIESGDIRAIQSDDPVFSVPAGFTKIAQ